MQFIIINFKKKGTGKLRNEKKRNETKRNENKIQFAVARCKITYID
jgi:hypothetical protein